jgi:LacI family transcriptional regulator
MAMAGFPHLRLSLVFDLGKRLPSGQSALMRKSAPASLAMIARQAGVSSATVSRIVNGQLDRANPATVERVQGVIEALGYRPNSMARALRRRESRVVAMLAPNLDNPAMAAIASSTETALREAGYVMILCDTHDQPELQDEYFEAMRAQFVHGYVLVSPVASRSLRDFLRLSGPAVIVNRRAGVAPGVAPFVGIDNLAAGAEAADFLLDAGVARPALIHSALSSSAIADRVQGFLDRVTVRGVPRHDIRVVASDKLRHLEAGYDAARRLQADGGWPEGLMCVSDQMAYGAYRLSCETGLRVPAECRIVGIDENPLNGWIAPWLSSVHIPYGAFGEAILTQLTALWAGSRPADLLLPHRMVGRG